MKIFVKTMTLLAFMTPLALASDGGHLRSNEPPFMRRQLDEKCTKPNDDYSEMVDLSYYPEDTPIEVTFDENGFPKQFFKFVGCSSGKTTFQFWTCGDQLGDADATLGFWKRDDYVYNPRPFPTKKGGIEYCFNDNKCSGCGLCEKAVDCVCNYDEEVYLNPGELSGNNEPFTFTYTASGKWPCVETATSTYVHGSTVVDMDPNKIEISTQFLFSGSMQNPEFDVVVFNDQTCTLGNELVGTVDEDIPQGVPPVTFNYINSLYPPFETPPDIIPPNDLNAKHAPHKVVLKAKKENFHHYNGLWVEDYVDGVWTGTLRYCMQFRVDKPEDNLVEFVDVAFKIMVDLEAECRCDDNDARQIEAAKPGSNAKCVCPCPGADPYCGPVTILRDDIFDEDVDVDPEITMQCGPCEGAEASVTQGDTLPVCMTLDGDWCFADQGMDELFLTVSDPNNELTTTTFQVYPNAPETLVSSPLACKGNQCVLQMTIPGNMISQIKAGSLSDGLLGVFSGTGAASIFCDDKKSRGPDDGDVVAVPFVGEPFNLDIEMKKEDDDDCDGRFFAQFLCRFREWLRRIRGKS